MFADGLDVGFSHVVKLITGVRVGPEFCPWLAPSPSRHACGGKAVEVNNVESLFGQ